MKKTGPILALAATALLTPHAMADTLDNVRQSISGTIPLETGAGEENSGVYLRVNAAANFADDVDIKNIPLNPNTIIGIQNGKISFDTGMNLDIGIGIPLAPSLAIEISSGVAYNSVDSVSGTWISVAGPDSVAGGDGHVYQVPLVAELVFSVYNNNTLQVNLRGGAGLQWTNADINNVYASSVGPAFDASLSGNAFAFRYQFGIDCLIRIAPNISLGATCAYSGTTNSNFGKNAFSANTGLVGTEDVKTGSFQNLTLGIGLKIDF
ncbi:MAG: hypothetical protein CBB69_010690 [Phycisphaera sp. TMED9]|nr:MAG: hypothetical protein CBB69_010690 [Phycisphaera sp. TMED9]